MRGGVSRRETFSERKGQPPYVEAYGTDEQGKPRLLGYVMLSTDITDTPAYSGKPVTLIGMDLKGRFVGVKVLKHSEPILLLGIPESALTKFNDQYLGKFVGDKVEIGRSRPDEGVVGLDAISGATVTVIAQNQVMMSSGGAVARQTGILAPTVRVPAKFTDTGRTLDWAALAKEGAVQRLLVRRSSWACPRFGTLHRAVVRRVERAGHRPLVAGQGGWDSLMSQLKPGEQAIFVIRTAGKESFKGSGFVRGGIYDRVQLRQGLDTFTFRDLDYLNLYGLEAAGAPRAPSPPSSSCAPAPSPRPTHGSSPCWATGSTGQPARAASPASRQATGCPRGRCKAAVRSSRNRRRPG